jgi:hypothetical protein
MGWTILNIFMTTSYLLLSTYVYLNRDLLALTIASITADLVGIGMFLRMSDYTRPRQERIYQIEKTLGMNHHCFVNQELLRKDVSLFLRFRHRYITIHKLKWVQLLGLVSAWVILWIKTIDPTYLVKLLSFLHFV